MSFPSIIGCPCAPITEDHVHDFLIEHINGKGYTVAINAEKILKYRSNDNLKNIIDNSILPYPDGAGAVLGLKWLHGLSSEKINMPILALDFANQNHSKIFIAGATKNIHAIAIKKIKKLYPHINLVGSMDGYNSPDLIAEQIVAARPQLILLALGSPRQELFAAKLLEAIDSGIVIGCGGALDIIAGKLKRAPKFWIDNNLEWAFRLIQQPWRLRRQLFLPKFIFILMLEMIKKSFTRFKR